jgi:hypothetical protein|nr:MAG TPA: hypothetical protein [Caudoviricetes sp.]
MSQSENISTTTRSRSEDISTSTKSQYTVKITTFNYNEAENKKVELPEGENDLKTFLLNIIKKEVSVDKIVTQFLDKNVSVYNMRKLDSIEIQKPGIELNHVWNEKGVNTIGGQFTLNIRYLPDDEIRYQVQIPFTPIGEEEHISDYEIHTYYYEGKIQSICNALLQGAIKHLESF